MITLLDRLTDEVEPNSNIGSNESTQLTTLDQHTNANPDKQVSMIN